jgi:GTP-binding protein
LEIKFVLSALKAEQYPKRVLPEVAFAGRSNVGKSSLLNTLWGKKGLARTSSTPGKTRTINFYEVENSYYFTDLPGYGYAKVPLQMRRRWAKAIEEYFRTRKNLRAVVLVMDSKLGPTELDLQLVNWLKTLRPELPLIPVLTKVDKASQKELSSALNRSKEVPFDTEVILFSAKTGQGKDKLWKVLLEFLQGKASL